MGNSEPLCSNLVDETCKQFKSADCFNKWMNESTTIQTSMPTKINQQKTLVISASKVLVCHCKLDNQDECLTSDGDVMQRIRSKYGYLPNQKICNCERPNLLKYLPALQYFYKTIFIIDKSRPVKSETATSKQGNGQSEKSGSLEYSDSLGNVHYWTISKSTTDVPKNGKIKVARVPGYDDFVSFLMDCYQIEPEDCLIVDYQSTMYAPENHDNILCVPPFECSTHGVQQAETGDFIRQNQNDGTFENIVKLLAHLSQVGDIRSELRNLKQDWKLNEIIA